MTDNAESVFARWSRLKRQQAVKAAARPQSGTAMAQPPSEDAAETTAGDRPKPPPAEKTPSDLPDIATLNKDSDFTLFLRRDVPEELHRQALRTLWRSDPIFSLRDGLTAYDEDYTAIGKVEQVVRTAYRVGQGYLAKEIREQFPDGVRRERETAAKSAPADRAAAANDPPTSADAADETSLLDHPEKTRPALAKAPPSQGLSRRIRRLRPLQKRTTRCR